MACRDSRKINQGKGDRREETVEKKYLTELADGNGRWEGEGEGKDGDLPGYTTTL